MTRKEFLTAVGSLAIVPSIFVLPRRAFRVPQTFALCFGESGRRIWTHLAFHDRIPSLFPMMVKKEQSVIALLKPLGQQSVTIISMLDDTLFTNALSLIRQSRRNRKVRLTAYLIHPMYDMKNLSGNVIANCNLRISSDTLDFVRTVNLPDIDPKGLRPHWPMEFYDEKLTDPEKQVIWELLRFHQPIRRQRR